MKNKLSIITYPNPILRKKSTKINEQEISNKKFQKLSLNMIKVMKEKNGKGLAAPQIGQNIRLIVIDAIEEQIIMINPVITKKSWAKEWGDEGCLSIPGVFGKVKRYKKINCEYTNKNGQKIKIKTENLLARVIQHETDHLDGVLFIDKAKSIERVT